MKKKIIKSLLGIVLLSIFNINISFANIDYSQCKLNNATCNIIKTDLDELSKNKLDYILSNFYSKIYKKYNSLYDIRYIYSVLIEKLKKMSSTGNIYDYRTKLIYYLYNNIETEYYKVSYHIRLQEINSNDNNLNNKVQNFLTNIKKKKNTNIKGNTVNDSFSKSKKILEKYIYNDKVLKRKTIYCGCDFSNKKKVDTSLCGYKDKIIKTKKNGNIFYKKLYSKRAMKIEWEHVVPAEHFGHTFKEWREGSSLCVNSKGQKFKGRHCAEKANKEYRYMQADLYNLYPSVGALNAFRSNYQVAEISGEKREWGKCDFEIDNRKMEPPQNMKGDIARVYRYMEITYPNSFSISDKNKQLFKVWERIDPISKEECKRYNALKQFQKNINIVLEDSCNNY